ALEQSAVLLPSRRSAAVPGVPGIGREWAPVARHVRCRPPSHVELARGIEPPTCGLQNRCSAVELRQRPRASAMVAYFTTGKATPARIFRKGAVCVIVSLLLGRSMEPWSRFVY